jgi:hypothetical protein
MTPLQQRSYEKIRSSFRANPKPYRRWHGVLPGLALAGRDVFESVRQLLIIVTKQL